jgi:hypothetical protein
MDGQDGEPCANASNWKALLPFAVTEGVLYEDAEVVVDCKIQAIRFLQRLMLTFKGKHGTHPESVNLEIISPDSLADKLTIQCSPVRHTPEGAQAVVMAMLSDSFC